MEPPWLNLWRPPKDHDGYKGGRGLHDAQSVKKNDSIADIFKDRHTPTDWLIEGGKRVDWSDEMAEMLEIYEWRLTTRWGGEWKSTERCPSPNYIFIFRYRSQTSGTPIMNKSTQCLTKYMFIWDRMGIEVGGGWCDEWLFFCILFETMWACIEKHCDTHQAIPYST